MSEAESSEFKGIYSQLSPRLVDEAYLLNDAYDIRAQAAKTEAKAAELEEELDREAYTEIEALLETKDLGHDEFLIAYESALLKLRQSARPLSEFNRAMELRSLLAPGVFLKTANDNIVTVAQSENGDPNYGIFPVLYRYDQRAFSNAVFVEFGWSVPVEEVDKPVLISGRTTVGKDAITKELDDRYSRHNINELESGVLQRAAAHYDKLGDVEKARRLKEKAVDLLVEFFSKEVFTTTSFRIYSHNVETNLDELEELNAEKYKDVLETAKRQAALGNYRDNIFLMVEAYAVNLAKRTAREEGKDSYYGPTPTEIAQLYADFALEGSALLEEMRLASEQE